MNPHRRHLMQAAGGLMSLQLLPYSTSAQATPESLRAAITAFTQGAAVQTGRVKLEIAGLVDNGNTVPVAVDVPSPMTAADHVQRIGLFNEANPQPEVAVFTLGPHNGRARVATRMRLATSQRVVALAQFSDGSWWQAQADVVVTLAACIEG
jgi:sulfur-oxidizing protein SoxY